MDRSRSTVGKQPAAEMDGENVPVNAKSANTIFWLTATVSWYMQHHFRASLWTVCLLFGQRGCWSDRSFHYPQHRLGANEIRGRSRHLSDGENAEDAETSYGADGGEEITYVQIAHCRQQILSVTGFSCSVQSIHFNASSCLWWRLRCILFWNNLLYSDHSIQSYQVNSKIHY